MECPLCHGTSHHPQATCLGILLTLQSPGKDDRTMDVLAMLRKWLERCSNIVARAWPGQSSRHVFWLHCTQGKNFQTRRFSHTLTLPALPSSGSPNGLGNPGQRFLPRQCGPQDTVWQMSVWCEWLYCSSQLCSLRKRGIVTLFP